MHCTTGLSQNSTTPSPETGSAEVLAKPAFQIEKDVAIEPFFGGYNLIANLGPLPAGATGTIHINLVNTQELAFPIKELEAGCRCASVEFDAKVIESGSRASLRITLSTPVRQKRATVTNLLVLVSSEDPKKNINLGLRYSLSGLMCFTENPYLQEVDPALENQTLMVPFLITHPVQADDVDFAVVPESREIHVSLAQEGGAHFAKIVFNPTFVGNDSQTFTIVARDQSRELRDEIPLLLRRRKQIELTPRTLRFHEDKERMKSVCLIRLCPPKNAVETAVTGPNLAMSIEAATGTQSLHIESKQLGNGIYRVYISASKEQLIDWCEEHPEDLRIAWKILTKDQRCQIETPFLLDTDNFFHDR